VPSPHTGIGILSSLIVDLEAHPYLPHLSAASPIYKMMECAARHSDGLDERIRTKIVAGGESDRQEVAEWIASQGGINQFLVQTSQAVDIGAFPVFGAEST